MCFIFWAFTFSVLSLGNLLYQIHLELKSILFFLPLSLLLKKDIYDVHTIPAWLLVGAGEPRERERPWPKPKNTGGHKEAWTDRQPPTDEGQAKKTLVANPDTHLTRVHPLAVMGAVRTSSLAVGVGDQA